MAQSITPMDCTKPRWSQLAPRIQAKNTSSQWSQCTMLSANRAASRHSALSFQSTPAWAANGPWCMVSVPSMSRSRRKPVKFQKLMFSRMSPSGRIFRAMSATVRSSRVTAEPAKSRRTAASSSELIISP